MKDFAEIVAEQVLASHPDGNKEIWGRAFLEVAEEVDAEALERWTERKVIAAAGRAVSDFKGRREAQRRNERLIARGISVATGRPISPTISVRSPDGSRQHALWTQVPPQEFVEAVMREQSIVDGRRDANAIRLRLVRMLQADEQLMALPTLGDVCAELDIDPDTLGLDELEAA